MIYGIESCAFWCFSTVRSAIGTENAPFLFVIDKYVRLVIKYKGKRRGKGSDRVLSEKRLTDMYRQVYSMPKLVLTLKILGALSVFYVAGVLIFGVAVLFDAGQYLYAAKLSVMAAIPFGIVSVMRLIINTQRPYEVFDIEELAPLRAERKSGRSFPSRHVFSAFLIGVMWLPYSVWFGLAAIILGAFLAVERVLLGIHFVKDVAAGAAIGALSGLVAILIL